MGTVWLNRDALAPKIMEAGQIATVILAGLMVSKKRKTKQKIYEKTAR
jgi:hypothetical protein